MLPLGQTKSPLTSGTGAGALSCRARGLREATGQASVANTAFDMRQPEQSGSDPSLRRAMVPSSRPIESCVSEREGAHPDKAGSAVRCSAQARRTVGRPT